MKLGVMAALFAQMQLGQALAYCQELGLEAIEFPVGGYLGDPWKLAGIHKDKRRLKELKTKIADNGLEVHGIAAHGNPVHPNKQIAKAHHEDHRNAILLAAEFDTVAVNFSGCPGGCKADRTPNFVTCPWPDDYLEATKYQWNEVLIPYWSRENDFAAKHGVKIAFEAHPGMTVHNPEDIVRLRKQAGKQLGANLDPSHFFWQMIDPVEVARYLGQNKCIFHVHAKDTAINSKNSRLVGVLDTKSYSQVKDRSWVFCTVGFGHGDEFWKPFLWTLRLYGYDGTVSIEHEDSLMSVKEGLEKAVDYLKRIIPKEKVGKAWWF